MFLSKDLCRQRMQAQPTGSKSPEIHKISPTSGVPTTTTTTTTGSHAKHTSEGSSNRSSTSSWLDDLVYHF